MQWGRRKQPPSLDESTDILDDLIDYLEDTVVLAHILSIITPLTPPPSQPPKSKSCAMGDLERNLMEQWLDRAIGESFRS